MKAMAEALGDALVPPATPPRDALVPSAVIPLGDALAPPAMSPR